MLTFVLAVAVTRVDRAGMMALETASDGTVRAGSRTAPADLLTALGFRDSATVLASAAAIGVTVPVLQVMAVDKEFARMLDDIRGRGGEATEVEQFADAAFQWMSEHPAEVTAAQEQAAQAQANTEAIRLAMGAIGPPPGDKRKTRTSAPTAELSASVRGDAARDSESTPAAAVRAALAPLGAPQAAALARATEAVLAQLGDPALWNGLQVQGAPEAGANQPYAPDGPRRYTGTADAAFRIAYKGVRVKAKAKAPRATTPTDKDIALLLATPADAPKFDAVYGAGAASEILGQSTQEMWALTRGDADLYGSPGSSEVPVDQKWYKTDGTGEVPLAVVVGPTEAQLAAAFAAAVKAALPEKLQELQAGPVDQAQQVAKSGAAALRTHLCPAVVGRACAS